MQKITIINEQYSKRQKAILFISTIVISLCKIVYVPMCLLLLVLSKEKFKEWREEKGIEGIPATLMGYGASNPGKIFDIAINNFSDTRKVLEMIQEGYTIREEWYIPVREEWYIPKINM